MLSRPVTISMIEKLMECLDEVETCGTLLKCLKAWMSGHRGWWCLFSFLPPRCECFYLEPRPSVLPSVGFMESLLTE